MGNTIVFIHGMFQNPKSWTKWIAYFESKGYTCLAPAWPLHTGEPSALRAHIPAGLGALSLEKVTAYLETLILNLPEKPVVIGHSVGGLIAQLLLNRDIAKTGVAISSVAPNAMITMDLAFAKNSAAIANPLKGDEPFIMDPATFHDAFANTLSEADSHAAYEAYATHDSRKVFRDCLGTAGQLDTEIPHAPLLLVAGEEDQICPASLVEKNFKAYTDEQSITAYREFAQRSHYICGEPGWEEVAGYVYDWLQAQETRVADHIPTF